MADEKELVPPEKTVADFVSEIEALTSGNRSLSARIQDLEQINSDLAEERRILTERVNEIASERDSATDTISAKDDELGKAYRRIDELTDTLPAKPLVQTTPFPDGPIDEILCILIKQDRPVNDRIFLGKVLKEYGEVPRG